MECQVATCFWGLWGVVMNGGSGVSIVGDGFLGIREVYKLKESMGIQSSIRHTETVRIPPFRNWVSVTSLFFWARPERNHQPSLCHVFSGVNENCEVFSLEKNIKTKISKVRRFTLPTNFHWIFLWCFQRWRLGTTTSSIPPVLILFKLQEPHLTAKKTSGKKVNKTNHLKVAIFWGLLVHFHPSPQKITTFNQHEIPFPERLLAQLRTALRCFGAKTCAPLKKGISSS